MKHKLRINIDIYDIN